MTATNNQIQTIIHNRKKRETNKIIITNIVLLYSADSIRHSILSEHNLCGIMTLVCIFSFQDVNIQLQNYIPF